MIKKNFLYLVSDEMAKYTLGDLENLNNVKIINRCYITKNKIVNQLFRIHTSVKLNEKYNLPLKQIWYWYLLKIKNKNWSPDYIIMTSAWYNEKIVEYLNKLYPDCKKIMQFRDTIAVKMKDNSLLDIEILKKEMDAIVVYNKLDAEKYGLLYHEVGYSLFNHQIAPKEHFDVVFIGTSKGRLADIRYAYKLFTNYGLKCFFYVTGVKNSEILDDGIMYAKEGMSFEEYIQYEISSDCLFEIVQNGSTGRTFRMMEAIIYNKKLITNCPEILETKYYNSDYVQYYNKVEELDMRFFKRILKRVDYKYEGDFSPIHLLEYVEKNVK